MVRDTSVTAYRQDDRTTIRDDIINHMGTDIWTRRELAQSMDMQASSMSGRINELIEEGRVYELPDKVTCEVTGRTVHAIARKRA